MFRMTLETVDTPPEESITPKKRRSSVIQKVISFITLESAWEPIIEDINNDVLAAGKPIDTIRMLRRIRIAIVFSAISILPVSIVLAANINPFFVSLNLVWILLFAFPKLQLAQLGQERKKRIEEELPSFVMFSSILQNAGVNLYDSFQYFKNSKLFKGVRNEALLLSRNVEFFGLSQIEALEDLGRSHKSKSFSDTLLGYTSIWRSGGDLANYLEQRTEEFFTLLRERYQSYANSVGTVVEVLVTLLIILPIMIMIASFVLPGSSMSQLALLASVGLPALAMVIGVVISSIQPASFDDLGLTENVLSMLFALGFGLGIASWFVVGEFFPQEQLWIAVATGFLVPTGIAAIIVGRQKREITMIEDALPQFLRDMTEFRKIGYDIVVAIIRLSKERVYNSVFDAKLKEVALLLEYGTKPTQAVEAVYFRPWMTRISFNMLAQIGEFGGGTPRLLETINRFIGNVRQSVREGKSAISIMTVLIFIAPVIMAFTTGIIQDMLGSIDLTGLGVSGTGGDLESGSGGLSNIPGVSQSNFGLSSNFMNIITITPEFVSMIKTIIVLSSMLAGVVIGKAIDFTFYNTWRVVAIGIIAISSIIMMDIMVQQDIEFERLLGVGA